MTTRALKTIGCITGCAALLLIATLMAVSLAAGISDLSQLAVFCCFLALDLLLGMASVGTFLVVARRSDDEGYIHGVGDTIDRLASCLPRRSHLRRVG